MKEDEGADINGKSYLWNGLSSLCKLIFRTVCQVYASWSLERSVKSMQIDLDNYLKLVEENNISYLVKANAYRKNCSGKGGLR